MTNRREFLRHAALAAAIPALAGADGPPPGRPFDDRVARALADARQAGRRFPGIAAAIVRGDRLLGLAAEGVRKLGSPAPMTPADRFHLGSCTKAMTATMVGAVVDSGKLGWDSTLGATFPDLADRMHAESRGVTLDQLLRHRAGLPANIDWQGVADAATTRAERRSVVASALDAAPIAPPGSKFEYSNLGYTLAGAMAEEAAGAPWEDLMRRHVFGPLGMASAGFGPPNTGQEVDQPWGHVPLGPVYHPTRLDNPAVMGPAGTAHVTLGDWAKFASFHLGDGTAGGRRLLSPATFARLHTTVSGEDYAGGWIVTTPAAWADGPLWQHAGSNTVWYAAIVLAPARRFGILVASNGGGKYAGEACQAVVEALRALEPVSRD